MPNKYVGITIGPIGKTMDLTSAPAGLWGASSLFSWVAKALIQALVQKDIPVNAFVSPSFQLNEKKEVVLSAPNELQEEMRSKGVGMFHDRIIFRSDDIQNAGEKVVNAIAEMQQELTKNLEPAFPDNWDSDKREKWVEEYLCIHAIEEAVPADQSPLMYLGKHLSILELESNFPTIETENPLLRLFENVTSEKKTGTQTEEETDVHLRNELMRGGTFFLTPPAKDQNEWILGKQKQGKNETWRIRDLQDIASMEVKDNWKYRNYYAVLTSDGDSMSKILEQMTPDNGEVDVSLQKYSRKCLRFCAEASYLIQRFGGMPIYAGGDDLLALVPIVGNYLPDISDPDPNEFIQSSIARLVERLRIMFNNIFAEDRKIHDGKPTISFGIAVQYYRSPLYEALERAKDMLRMAKGGQKNACFLNLQKHSGQSILISEENMDQNDLRKTFYARLESLFQKISCTGGSGALTFLSSAGYQIERHRNLFFLAIDRKNDCETILNNLFKNLFDNTDQKKYQSYLEELKACAVQIIQNTPIYVDENGNAIEAQEDYRERLMALLQSTIRVVRFFREEAKA
jgi:CRISPR-associated protein Cmr2